MGMIGTLNPRKTVVATFRILKECVELVKNYPRRSVELWTQDKVIDPIALLSTSRPAKNLGLMTFEQVRTGDKLTKYYEQGADMANEEVIADRETLVKLIVSTLENSELGQYVRSQMDKPDPVVDEVMDEQEVTEDEAVVEDEPVKEEKEEEEEAVDDEDEPAKDESVAESKDDPAEKFEADGEVEQMDEDLDDDPRLMGLGVEREEHPDLSTDELLQIVDDHLAEDPEYYKKEFSAGGDNTMIPDEKIVEKKSMSDAVKEATLERYAADNVSLRESVAKLESDLRRAYREKEVFRLNARYAFDLDDELKLVEDFNDSQFVRHCEVIKGRYAEYPVNRGAKVHPVATEEGMKPEITMEKVNKAVALATQLKCSFAEALKQV
jgi:hypothetical protein